MQKSKLKIKNKAWRKVKLGEALLEVDSGGRPVGGTLTVFHGVPSIGAEHLNDNGGFDFSKIKYVPEKYYEKSSRGKVKFNDVLCVKDGATIGKVSRITKNFPFLGAMVNEHVFIVRSKPNLLDQPFLFYKLRTREGRETIKNSVGGSAQGGLKKDFLDYWEIDLPSLPEQKRIADILSAFDDKIEMNNKISRTLEEMASAIFKEWFVKFNFPVEFEIKSEKHAPYRNKVSGAGLKVKSLGYKEADGKMVNSELGKIPEGWEVKKLPKVFDFLEGPGIRNWQYTSKGCHFINIRLIQNSDIDVKSANFISEGEAYGKYKHFHLQERDMVVSTSGTLGRSAIVRKEHLPLLLNTSVIRFRPKDGSYAFMYQFLNSSYFQNMILSMASGSAQPNFGPVHLKQIEVFIPSKKILDTFSNLVNPIYERIIANMSENQKLAALRDLLLPKLMSGEVKA